MYEDRSQASERTGGQNVGMEHFHLESPLLRGGDTLSHEQSTEICFDLHGPGGKAADGIQGNLLGLCQGPFCAIAAVGKLAAQRGARLLWDTVLRATGNQEEPKEAE